MEISFNKHSLIVDNEPVFIKSAALHYFRCPGEKTWKDRLRKLKAAGYNTVDLYFCANYHSEKEGEYDFSDIKDVSRLLEITRELGLFVIARPGPFINAETAAGGLPFWLVANKDVIPRNRLDGNYVRSPEYMAFVEEWYDQIIPILNKFDNIIAFQIENEYSTNMMEPDYMQELYTMVRKKGINVPLFHNDAYCAGLYADVVDIYACDTYPYISPEHNWREETDFCFDTLDHLEETIRMYKTDAPLFIAEMQSGWFDKWCSSYGYKHIRESLGDEHINIVTKTALSQGVTMFNHYMGAGGTSWDDMACDEVYSCYDFAAPIAENGIPQANYYKAKEINYFLDAFNFSATDACENPLVIRPNDKLFIKTRRDHINLCNWIFIRNLNPDVQKVGAFDFNFELQPYDMKIIPYNLVLKGCKIDLSSLSIFGKIATEDKEAVILILEEDNSIKISDYDTFSLDEKLSYKEEVNSVILNFNDIEDLDFAKASFTRFGKQTEFIFLKKQTAAKTWILDNKFIFGADFIWPNKNELAVSQSATIKTYDLETYSERRIDFDEKKPHFEVTRFRSAYCAKEIDIPFVEASWPVCDGGTDSFTNKIYNEFIWYKTTFDGTVDTFYICAKHCFALYLNGQQIFEHNSYCYEHLYEREECVTIMPDKSFFKEKNELTILIQNLGFDKGFSNDTNLPRGLLSFGSLPERDFVWKIKGGLTPKDENWPDLEQIEDTQNHYMQYVEMDFTFHKKMSYSPLYLSFEKATFNRATIYLNGQ
ncbi:MAG: beta-galactosidase, partial [Candidatus Gastranaerophilales bacterium]|nr:beta-galactosidase [Candidatus Gastranaerophilales bacterium]